MARLTGGKSRRQKIRRDSRKDKVEARELAESQLGDAKLQLTEFVSVSELAEPDEHSGNGCHHDLYESRCDRFDQSASRC
jgi:hypothetical protein